MAPAFLLLFIFMDKLRMQIRNFLKETVVSDHFTDRTLERLLSNKPFDVGYESSPTIYETVGKYTIPSETTNEALNKIQILKNTNFPNKKDYAVKICSVFINPTLIQYTNGHNPNTVKGKNLVLMQDYGQSNGTIYYAIIRRNELKTLMLMKNYIKIDSFKLNVDNIISDWNIISSKQIR